MRFSIITVCKNMGEELELTIKSVAEQTFKDFEYIVIDGKSTDQTVNVINKFRDNIDKYVCEEDGGIYDAMNKAIELSSGEYLYFLNAGDAFFDNDSLKMVSKEITTEDLIYGNVVEVDSGRERLNKFNNVNDWFLIRNAICHQAMFIKRSSFIKFGDYNTKFKIAADYEWLLRVWDKEIAKKYISVTVARFLMGGKSSNIKYRKKVLEEYDEIRKKYFNYFEILRYRIYATLVKIYQSIR
ncbi:MAG: glycosyltransferase family 2 protein [Microgenomates group bacterium]